MAKYKIVRFYQKRDKRSRVIKRGLTKKEAMKHCQDPKTSGDGWFDGFTKEGTQPKTKKARTLRRRK